MAQITELIHTNDDIQTRTNTVADYCFNNEYFQIRTYSQNDIKRENGAKQNIQINKDIAKNLIDLLNTFIEDN